MPDTTKRTPLTRVVNTDHVPVWEQVLRRLATSNLENDYISRPLLELCNQLSRQTPPLERLLKRLPSLVGAVIPGSVVIITENTGRRRIISSNIGRLAERAVYAILRELPASGHFTIQAPQKKLTLGKDTYSQICTSAIGPSLSGQLCLSVFTIQALTPEQVDIAQLACQMLGLRADLNRQTSRLVQEQERFVGITHQLSEGMAILDCNLRVTVWNRPLQHITGFAPKAAIGQIYQESIQRIDNPDWLTQLIDEYKTQSYHNVFTAEFQLLTRTKQPKWVSVSGSFLRNVENQIEQVIIIVRDISHSKELEQRKSEFTSIATHELRTPITAISGYLSLIDHSTDKLSEKQRLYLERAIQASQRLVRLAEDLLRVTQLEENRTQFNRQPVEIVALLDKLVADFSQKAKVKNISLTLTSGEEQLIIADPDRLSQAIANLIDNALKYTEKGSVNITVETKNSTQSAEPIVVIILKDSGRGISAKEQEVIFDKFRRGQSASISRESGAGLGLYIVKSFIEKQGGTITVSSRPNHGTIFKITFPASLEHRQGNLPNGSIPPRHTLRMSRDSSVGSKTPFPKVKK